MKKSNSNGKLFVGLPNNTDVLFNYSLCLYNPVVYSHIFFNIQYEHGTTIQNTNITGPSDKTGEVVEFNEEEKIDEEEDEDADEDDDKISKSLPIKNNDEIDDENKYWDIAEENENSWVII